VADGDIQDNERSMGVLRGARSAQPPRWSASMARPPSSTAAIPGPPGSFRADGLTSDEREELRRLRREVRALREEARDPQKGAAFFARDSEIRR
jgi:hypothetical protein